MSLRDEVVTLKLVRGQPTLGNFYGLAWNQTASGNTAPSSAVLLLEVEFEGGFRERFQVRPGAWYGFGRLVTRAWLTSATAGDVVLEVGYEPGDNVLPPAALPVPSWLEEVRACPYSRAINATNLATTPWVETFNNPGWAIKLAIDVAYGITGPNGVLPPAAWGGSVGNFHVTRVLPDIEVDVLQLGTPVGLGLTSALRLATFGATPAADVGPSTSPLVHSAPAPTTVRVSIAAGVPSSNGAPQPNAAQLYMLARWGR